MTPRVLGLLVPLGFPAASHRSRSKVFSAWMGISELDLRKESGRGWDNLYPDLINKAEINNQYYFRHGTSNPTKSSAHQDKDLTPGLIFTWFIPEA